MRHNTKTTMSTFEVSYDTSRSRSTGSYDDDDESSTPKLKRMAPYLCATWILISLIFLIVLRVQFTNGANIDGAMEGIYKNLGAFPFSDIVFPDNATDCPSGYQAATLGKWPGTMPFCYDVDIIQTYFKENKCRKKYAGQNSSFYHVWKSTSACIKPVNFLNTSTCPSGYTKCTVGVCVEGTDCPITQMKVQSTPENGAGWLNTSFPDGKYLNFRKDEGVPPIVSLELDLGSPTPCVNIYELPIQKNYAAIWRSGIGCLTPGQFAGTTILDEDTAYNAFKSQYWSYPVLSLPMFNDTLQNQKAYLTAIPRIQLKDASGCTNFNLQAFTAGGDGLYLADNLSANLSFFSLLLVSVSVLMSAGYFWAKHAEKNFVALLFILTLLVIGLSIMAVVAPLNINKYKSSVVPYEADFASIEKSQCFTDASLNAVMTQYLSGVNALRKVATLWTTYAVLYFVTLALAVVSVLVHACHKLP